MINTPRKSTPSFPLKVYKAEACILINQLGIDKFCTHENNQGYRIVAKSGPELGGRDMSELSTLVEPVQQDFGLWPVPKCVEETALELPWSEPKSMHGAAV
jgi:hypothetical protein